MSTSRAIRAATSGARRWESDEYWTLIGVKNARITARAGFTTVRDLGSAPLVGFALARGTAEGLIVGPAHRRLRSRPFRSSAATATPTAFRPEVTAALGANNTCTGPQECAARVRQLAQAGRR
jgi:imidazolonepropionase-like amidohydrolase